ncbi:hypothetical protein PCYB_074350 [Plasmodium cynomolgi strain B]|uniref:Uncharacterized protein n=1 Tax=Plasmodium cynomolgi (strain B) TaxID=1120755 RepID=K6URY8_PLACD|nr:hypothetical protein PCYB_074350 [Plasmodium cynomolgi strain B]GAB65934.1 hypothetical protein PCYB_074350 [Plasmodium cynomolgi strain B]
MQEKTNNPLILSTKVFTFFLIVCAWKYPFQSSSFRNSSSTSNLNNTLGELRGRLLKGGTAVERHAQDAVLRERLVNILHDDDETIKDRLNELIQEEKRKKNVESTLSNGKLLDELTQSSNSGKGANASQRQGKHKKYANTGRFKVESTDSLNLSIEINGSTGSLSGAINTISSTGSLNRKMDNGSSTKSLSLRSDDDASSGSLSLRSDDDASTKSLSLRSDDDASSESLSIRSDDNASTESQSLDSTSNDSTTTMDSIQLDDYLEKEFELELSDNGSRGSISLDDKYYVQDTITEKNEK